MSNNNKSWSDEELNILVTNNDLSVSELTTLLPNRSPESISSKRSRLKDEPKKRLNGWTEEETDILVSNLNLNDKELHKLLPHKSFSAVRGKKFKIIKDRLKLTSKEDNFKVLILEITYEIDNLSFSYYEILNTIQKDIEKLRKDHKNFTDKLKLLIKNLQKTYLYDLISNTQVNSNENNSQKKKVSTKKSSIKLKEERSLNNTIYENAVKEFKDIYRKINEYSLSNEKDLIIGEILYLLHMEKNIKRKNNIEKGILEALMIQPLEYWENGKNLKLSEWMDHLEIIGKNTNFKESINLAA